MNEILAIIIFNLVLYYDVINYGLVIDDIKWYKDYKKHKGWNIFKLLSRKLYGGATFGLNAETDHCFSIFLNIVTCILIYKSLGNNNVSFFASLLYACNPANNQTSIWLNGRRYIVNIILVLTMISMPYGILLYLIMPLFQINAIFSPVLINPYLLLITPIFLLMFKNNIINWFKNRYEIIPEGELRQFKLKRIIPIIKTFGFYFFKMIFPGVTLLNYPTLYFWGITKEGNKDAYSFNLDAYKSIIALIIAILGLFYFKDNLFNMWLFMILAIGQWCNVITATQTLADRYMSMPNVFMMFFVSYLIHLYAGIYAFPIICLLIGYYTCQLQITKRMYKDINDMYEYNMYFYPEGVTSRSFKASSLVANKDFFAAWDIVREGLHHQPNDFKLLYLGAICLKSFGSTKQAMEFIEKAEKNYYLGQENKLSELIVRFKSSLIVK